MELRLGPHTVNLTDTRLVLEKCNVSIFVVIRITVRNPAEII
jgi:hypothetical protein